MPHDFDPAVHRRRRDALAARMRAAGGGVAVIATATATFRNADVEHAFRHDSHFYYLTGFTEPDATLLLSVDDEGSRASLLCRPRDPAREVWDGRRLGVEAAPEALGVDAARDVALLDETVLEALKGRPALFASLSRRQPIESKLLDWIRRVTPTSRDASAAAPRLVDIAGWIDDQRLIKDAHELGVMQRAADISSQAHVDAMAASRPGRWEYEIEAKLLHAFRRRGAQHTAYPSIVASGANACVLHYGSNDARLGDHDLLLIDAGCELDGYASDITRTFPVSGKFSAAQRALYDVVLASQLAAIDATRAGASFDAPHLAAVRVLTQGMVDHGLLEGAVDGLIESGAYKRFYLHRTGHWLGMDVHDVGGYRDAQGEWVKLAPGMVVTVEPGLYVPAAADVDARFHDIGIRIEDDVVVTDGAATVLTAAAPKDPDAIERLVGTGRA